jgi:hypothetical protein
LDCVVTLVPKYCDSFTNTTCICTTPALGAAIAPCPLAACNITEALRFERYSKDSCGIPNDDSRVRSKRKFDYVASPLTALVVAGRLFARIKLKVGLGADDWMIIAALICFLIDNAFGLGILLNGFGQHTQYLTTSQITNALKVNSSMICQIYSDN